MKRIFKVQFVHALSFGVIDQLCDNPLRQAGTTRLWFYPYVVDKGSPQTLSFRVQPRI